MVAVIVAVVVPFVCKAGAVIATGSLVVYPT